MITVTKKTQDLTEGIMALCDGAKQDYYRYATRGVPGDITGYQKEQYDEWDSKTQIKNGKKYIKIIQEHRVFAFIVKEAFKHFKRGDILKPAGWQAPALNSPRGNVLEGGYPIQWTGPLYLK